MALIVGLVDPPLAPAYVCLIVPWLFFWGSLVHSQRPTKPARRFRSLVVRRDAHSPATLNGAPIDGSLARRLHARVWQTGARQPVVHHELYLSIGASVTHVGTFPESDPLRTVARRIAIALDIEGVPEELPWTTASSGIPVTVLLGLFDVFAGMGAAACLPIATRRHPDPPADPEIFRHTLLAYAATCALGALAYLAAESSARTRSRLRVKSLMTSG